MKRVFIIAITAPLAALAWAGTLPNAAEPDVMRLGFFASGGVQNYFYMLHGLPYSEFYEVRAYGAGGGAWAQYDQTWFSYAMRFKVTEFGGSGFRATFIEWDHDYYLYLAKGGIRPFIEPNASIGSAGGFRACFGIGGGVRWNMRDSPFYATVSGGYKYVGGDDYEKGDWSIGKVSIYFALSDAVALYAGAEAERSSHDYRYKGHQSDGPRWRGRVDVGPSWAF
ncbi:MAG: hypothetical protein V3T41_03080 [bacterium]